LFGQGDNILDEQQFDDAESWCFFMRVVFDSAQADAATNLRTAFAPIAERFALRWSLTCRAARRRGMIWVSKFDHWLADLIYRWQIGELAMDLAGIAANHPRDTYGHLEFGSVRFFHCAVTRHTKTEKETELWRLVRDTDTERVVLARYLQVPSDGLSNKLLGRCITIHHSFLPGFKGAKPYHQAHERGVKLIGETAHYVTSDLDEGPIMEKDVACISHRDSPEDRARKGRDIERRVLARAVGYHIENRIILNGKTTAIFAN
jgi:formyltetrahydrofolate deformylase